MTTQKRHKLLRKSVFSGMKYPIVGYGPIPYRSIVFQKHQFLVQNQLLSFLDWYDRTVKREALYNSKLV